MWPQISLWSSFTDDHLSVERSSFQPIHSNEEKLILKYSLNWCASPLNRGIKWWFSHLALFSYIGTVVSNGGFHHISLYSRILEPWYQMVVFTTSLSILVYCMNPKAPNVGEQFNLFDKLCQQYFLVVNIHTILTWGFQSYWGFSTQTETRYTASFCFWCGHWLPSSCNIACLQLLNCFWCARGHKSYSCITPEPWPWQG